MKGSKDFFQAIFMINGNKCRAKNFKDVVIIPSKSEYATLAGILREGAQTTIEQRRHFAERAFEVSSQYDTAIHAWFETSEK